MALLMRSVWVGAVRHSSANVHTSGVANYVLRCAARSAGVEPRMRKTMRHHSEPASATAGLGWAAARG